MKLNGFEFFLFCILFSCSDIIEEEEDVFVFKTEEVVVSDTSFFDYNKGVENALKKAQHIAEITWTPKGNIPKWSQDKENSLYYLTGHTYKGLPFSSVKEIGTYVFRDVSVYTFMSAINNPNSKIYTEDISKPPYHGKGGVTYYGTTCSQSVNYILGIDGPYPCRDYPKIGFSIVDNQTIDNMKTCDVLWNSGHTMMIYGIERDLLTHVVKSVSVFEVNSIRRYTRDAFMDLWRKGDYSLMRYKYLGGNLSYTPTPFVTVGDEVSSVISFNDDLCPDKGDKSCYRIGETVIINTFNPQFNTIIVEDFDGNMVLEVPVCEMKGELKGLPYGVYFARAYDGTTTTDTVSFEIIDTKVKLQKLESKIYLDFHSDNAIPKYIELCDESGVSYGIKDLSYSDVLNGRVCFYEPSIDDPYVKVAFQGKYGTITNSPQSISF